MKSLNTRIWENFLWALGIACVISFIILCVQGTYRRHDNYIHSWAKEHGYTVKNIERVGFWNDSPFWRRKGDDLCRVELQGSGGSVRTSYFQFGAGLLGLETKQAWQKE